MTIHIKAARDIAIQFRGWDLVIPQATMLRGAHFKGNEYAVTACAGWIADERLRATSQKPHSMFKHDAYYYYAWIPADACEAVRCDPDRHV